MKTIIFLFLTFGGVLAGHRGKSCYSRLRNLYRKQERVLEDCSYVIDCGDPEGLDNAEASFSSTSFGSVASYTCNDGFESCGDEITIVCKMNGMWSTPVGSCKAIDCGDPEGLDNAEASFSSTTFGSEASYTCNEGFVYSGDEINIVCGMNGMWSTPVGSCEAFGCGALVIKNAETTIQNNVVGGTATYECSEEFDNTGTEDIICLESGEWAYQGEFCICQGFNQDGSKFKPIRLVDGVSGLYGLEGEVEIFFQNEWRRVCDDGWNNINGGVVCQQLGRQLGLDLELVGITTDSAFSNGMGLANYWLDDVECEGTEVDLASCCHFSFGDISGPCGGIGDNAGVMCQMTSDVANISNDLCYGGAGTTVRLVGGLNPMEGDVEILHDGEWRRVCDDLWTVTNAQVVCRQLGFPSGGASFTKFTSFAQKSCKNFWLDDVVCRGEESVFEDCPANDWGENNCGKSQSAGVICA